MKKLQTALTASLICILGSQITGCADMQAEPQTEVEWHLGSIKEDKTIDQACATRMMQSTLDNMGIRVLKSKRRAIRRARRNIRKKCQATNW